MSTATETKPNGQQKAQPKDGQLIEFVPLGETAPITLTLARVRQYLCTPTKSGKMPSDEQVIKFMMMCKAGGLNPWVNDAYLVGYDGKDGPQFSLITSHQALLKRAEASPDYDGMESGVIVLRDGVITERQGDFILDGETLAGAWAKVYRRDRRIPSYDAINLKAYDKQRSLWNSDKAGMIVKCAEASAMRKAFPSTLAAMYCREEMDRNRDEAIEQDTRSKVDRLAERYAPTVSETKTITHEPAQPAFIQPEADDRELQPVERERPTEQHDQPIEARQQAIVARFMSKIQRAANSDDLTTIIMSAEASQADGSLTAEDVQQIVTACEARNQSFEG